MPTRVRIALVCVLWLCSSANWLGGYPTTHPGQIGYASWYSVASCKEEGASGTMANGKKLNDSNKTFACWHLPFGTKVEFTNIRNGKKVTAVCTDRGPAKRLVKKGRLFDLSKDTFSAIEDLNKGIVKIEWKVLTH